MRQLFMILTGSLMGIVAMSQTITLEECLENTRANFPLLDQKIVQQEMGESLSNALWYAYIPQLALEGRMTHQSHVTELDVTMPQLPGMPPMVLDLPEIPKLQYQAYLQATQLIWDGGRVNAGSRKIKAETEVHQAEVDVQLQKIEEAVTELYFSLLMLERQQELQQILINELARQERRIASALNNGVATENDLDLLRVERLKAEQSSEQLQISREAVLESLSLYTGRELSTEIKAAIPTVPVFATKEEERLASQRAEHALFDAKLRSAEASWQSYKAGGMPTIALFARGGYGRPGLNMLNPDPMSFYIGGITLSWNFGKLYDFDAQRKKLQGTSLLIELQRQALEREIASKEAQYTAEARQYQALVDKDKEIVALRKRVAERGKLQENEGTLSTTDYLQQISNYHAAEQTAEVHRLQYLRALYRLKNNFGL
ncbi:MAG: TolC family protein [Bacteroidales bacterium]|uniref:TolC family protein n=1 Tax=Porphyromonas sp. TaxID=1924944 RepID=UPI00297BABA7|nr:TolC family protein [Porphyromonas sp.]MDD7437598.1 TolC family protein [Bacteroidales bacterium]MDY3066370.1 TolC family protein [Porphyromonas sp.]